MHFSEAVLFRIKLVWLVFVTTLATVAIGCCTADVVPLSTQPVALMRAACPSLTPVAQVTRENLASELAKLSPTSAVAWAVSDWIALRAEVRACHDAVK